ncbi:MAG: chloride channel protein [Lachnospiraceae bacterium]
MKKTLVLIAVAVPTGIAVGAVDAFFGRVLLYLGAVRDAHTAWFLPFLGLIGALMAWAYKRYGAGCENGMGMVFEAGHAEREAIPLRLVPFVICATWLTHLFGGSAGREGVAVQLGAAISHRIGGWLRDAESQRIMLIAGIAAGFSGLFGTPFAATAFAMEVLTAGKLEHRALLPAAVAALCASTTAGLLGLEKFSFPLAAAPEWSAELVLELTALGIVFGLTGAAFAFCLKRAKNSRKTASKTRSCALLSWASLSRPSCTCYIAADIAASARTS